MFTLVDGGVPSWPQVSRVPAEVAAQAEIQFEPEKIEKHSEILYIHFYDQKPHFM
jgi:hypothetical protein